MHGAIRCCWLSGRFAGGRNSSCSLPPTGRRGMARGCASPDGLNGTQRLPGEWVCGRGRGSGGGGAGTGGVAGTADALACVRTEGRRDRRALAGSWLPRSHAPARRISVRTSLWSLDRHCLEAQRPVSFRSSSEYLSFPRGFVKRSAKLSAEATFTMLIWLLLMTPDTHATSIPQVLFK